MEEEESPICNQHLPFCLFELFSQFGIIGTKIKFVGGHGHVYLTLGKSVSNLTLAVETF